MTTNLELEDMINKLKIKNFKGIFSRDQLSGTPQDTECGILNLDSKDGPGTHWTAYYRDNKNNYYFSSFGDDPPLELYKYLNGDILTHTFRIQDFADKNCGEFSVLFLHLMSKGLDYFDVILFMVSPE